MSTINNIASVKLFRERLEYEYPELQTFYHSSLNKWTLNGSDGYNLGINIDKSSDLYTYISKDAIVNKFKIDYHRLYKNIKTTPLGTDIIGDIELTQFQKIVISCVNDILMEEGIKPTTKFIPHLPLPFVDRKQLAESLLSYIDETHVKADGKKRKSRKRSNRKRRSTKRKKLSKKKKYNKK